MQGLEYNVTINGFCPFAKTGTIQDGLSVCSIGIPFASYMVAVLKVVFLPDYDLIWIVLSSTVASVLFLVLFTVVTFLGFQWLRRRWVVLNRYQQLTSQPKPSLQEYDVLLCSIVNHLVYVTYWQVAEGPSSASLEVFSA